MGDKPTEARVRGLVAWVAGRKETEFLKRIDLNAWDIRDESVGVVLPPSFTVVKRPIYRSRLVRSARRQ